ncbi:MAG: ferrochelatase, partial [Acidobacteria bacterium]|nr:ferrochelatase [Acidobacteriota bacterium]
GVGAVRDALSKLDSGVTLTIMPPFYARPEDLSALVAAAEDSLRTEYDHLLFSFHGLPKRHLRKTDPTGGHCLTGPDCCLTPSPAHATCYRAQVFATAKEFVARTGIPEGKYTVAFQSRFGRDKWLEPMTDAEIVRLANQGVRRLLVICPAFVADCLETLEEIGIRGQDAFLEAGGEELQLVPCLNDHPRWIETLAGWCSSSPTVDGGSR